MLMQLRYSVLRYRAEFVQSSEPSSTESGGEPIEEEASKDEVVIPESEMNTIVASLKEIVRMQRNADVLIV